MSEEIEVVDAPKVTQRFCKGNMPMALVWYIKFFEDQDNRSEIARSYFTTVGKITDIQTDSNQKYIVENMKWELAELDAMSEVVRANFVRGQDNELIMANPDANKRKLATTNIEDADYSLEVLEDIKSMEFADDAISLADARAAYNAANPRKTKAKDEPLGETEADQTEEAVTESDEDAVDDLLS